MLDPLDVRWAGDGDAPPLNRVRTLGRLGRSPAEGGPPGRVAAAAPPSGKSKKGG